MQPLNAFSDLKLICIAIMISTLMFATQTNAATLAGYWSFDNDNAADDSGNGNDGTLINSPAFSTDTATAIGGGKSLSLTSTTTGPTAQRVQVSASASLNIADSLTVSYWVKADSTDQINSFTGMISRLSGGQGWSLLQRFSGTSIQSRIDTLPNDGINGEANQNGGIVADVYNNEWHHIALVLDNGTVKTYLDGNLQLSRSYLPGEGVNSNNRLIFGDQDSGNRPLNGLLDEIAIYNGVLTDTDIQALANGANPTTIPEPGVLTLMMLGGLLFFSRRS